ncbi:MAG: tRNA pseudouridine(38-40) synthase TruA [Acidimicrobiales bacterium]
MTLFDDVPDQADDDPAPERAEGAADGPHRRIRMTVAYDGTGFHGFAVQAGQKTVAGAIIDAANTALRTSVDLQCAGRTDRGVHANGQVVHLDLPLADVGDDALDLDRLHRSLNAMLSPKIVVRDIDEVDDSFHARFSATARRYRYTVLNRPVPDPFLRATAWHIDEPLDLRAMQQACDPLIGEHDFSSFCRRPNAEATLVRRLHDARWVDLGDDVIQFRVEANAFCHQMVRSLVGLLVDVGRGRTKAGDVAWIIRRQDRQAVPNIAPPHGLCLWEVSYGDGPDR